jgi:nitrogen PTS system EIIA component
MHHNSINSPDLCYYFTHENIRTFNEPLSVHEVVNHLLLNLAVTVGIGNVEAINHRYLEKFESYQLERPGDDVFVVHFRVSHLDIMHLSLGFVKHPFLDANVDLSPPAIVILVATPHSRPDLFYRVYGAIQTLANDNGFVHQLFNENNPERIWELINNRNCQLTRYVAAHQIMQSPRISINDTDNLETAIDLLSKYRSKSLPVVDKDNELIGEVSLEEILDVCFPRHILWMNDITPIIHFESFRNLLDNESVTWLTEILNHRVATVQLNDPAVKAAIEMSKAKVDHVYVLSDKTLVGIITLKTMTKMILRQ